MKAEGNERMGRKEPEAAHISYFQQWFFFLVKGNRERDLGLIRGFFFLNVCEYVFLFFFKL